MHVFTELWIQESRAVEESRPRAQRSLPYLVATDDDHYSQELRTEIESLVASLPLDSRERVVRNLRTDEHFWQTYHELVIGNLLKERGLQTKYDHSWPVDGKPPQTPDWTICSDDSSQCLIVEVFTKNISGDEAQLYDLFTNLRMMLEEIPLDIELNLTEGPGINNLNQHGSEMIVVKATEWVKEGSLSIGSKLAFQECTIEVIDRGQGRPKVQCSSYTNRLVVSTPLRANLKAKIGKYRALVSTKRIPFAIGVIAANRTGLDAEELEEVLFGNRVVDVDIDKATGNVLSQSPRWEVIGASAFSVGDIKSPVSLAAKLNQQSCPVSQFLWTQIPSEARLELSADAKTKKEIAKLERTLRKELNLIIHGASIHEAQRFEGVALSKQTLSLLSHDTNGERLLRLNRLLLEDVYPEELIKNHSALFAEEPLLSGVIWAKETSIGKWQMKSYFNPCAKNPLPSVIAGKLQ